MLETGTKNQIEELIKNLARAIQLARMYAENHKLTQDAIQNLYNVLTNLLAGNQELTLGIIGNEFAFQKEPLYEFSKKRQGFINHLKALGIKKISFIVGVENQELLDFCKILGSRPDAITEDNTIENMMAEKSIRHIILGEIGIIRKKKNLKLNDEQIEALMKKRYQGSVNLLTKTMAELKDNQQLNVQSAKQIVDSLINNMLKNKNLLLMLTSMKNRNENMFEHGLNVAVFTLLQAEMLGIEQKYLVDVGMASMLHDIGKLSKPLEEDQNEDSEGANFDFDKINEVRTLKERIDNDIKGAKILLETDGIGVLPALVAFEHNINFDQSEGGPKKVYGKNLNLISMMLAISDYYDKLRKKPAYYESGGPEKAYEAMMKLSGKNFHPDLLKNFFSVIGVYPPGTLVELDSHEVALVIQASMLDIRRPQVEILYNDKGEKLKEPFIVNLVEKNKKGKFKRSIIKSISPLEDIENNRSAE